MTITAEAAALMRTASGLRLHTVDDDGSERIINVQMNGSRPEADPDLFVEDGTLIFSKDHESKNYIRYASQQ